MSETESYMMDERGVYSLRSRLYVLLTTVKHAQQI